MTIDDATRPRLARRADRPLTSQGQLGQQQLVAIHDQLRAELQQVSDVVDQVVAGSLDPTATRSLINRLTMRQNYWSVGAFCQTYCRILTLHHTIEDQRLFRDLGEQDPDLGPVLERLSAEHEVIAEVLERLDRALVAMVDDPARVGEVRTEVVALRDSLLSHLRYEEEQLLEPIGRSTIVL